MRIIATIFDRLDAAIGDEQDAIELYLSLSQEIMRERKAGVLKIPPATERWILGELMEIANDERRHWGILKEIQERLVHREVP